MSSRTGSRRRPSDKGHVGRTVTLGSRPLLRHYRGRTCIVRPRFLGHRSGARLYAGAKSKRLKQTFTGPSVEAKQPAMCADRHPIGQPVAREGVATARQRGNAATRQRGSSQGCMGYMFASPASPDWLPLDPTGKCSIRERALHGARQRGRRAHGPEDPRDRGEELATRTRARADVAGRMAATALASRATPGPAHRLHPSRASAKSERQLEPGIHGQQLFAEGVLDARQG